jgi:predicted Zn-dependent protease
MNTVVAFRPCLQVIALAGLALLSGCSLPLMSETELASASAAEFQKMRNSMNISTDANTRAYVGCVADAIIRELPRPYNEKDWDIEVFDSGDVNAFAMPGGKIGVFTGLLKVARNQDQLGAVLGHEVAHVTEQHSLKRANRELTTRAGVIGTSAVLGGGQAVGSILSMGAQLGLSLPFSRANETESDTVGLKYMAAAGFNPQESITLWKNMDKNSKLDPPQFLSTHPSSSSRIQDLVAQLPPALGLYNQARAAGKRPDCSR